jgi:peptidoglycan/xylan/chitin deacetylase (PgdA/CDA1 family)
MYLIHTPHFIQNLFPSFIWRVPTSEKKIFLTFDDGPIPNVTPWVLNLLDQYNAKATFFCVGDNVRKHPDIFQEVVDRGHIAGNHTFNHLNGWSTDNIPYFHNVRHCARIVEGSLFRPPYGKLKPKQIQFLTRHYEIIMWDVLSGDFDQSITPQQCYENVIQHSKEGSIVVFHDSVKAWENLKYTLPKMLDYLSKAGYSFEALNPQYMRQSEPILKTA